MHTAVRGCYAHVFGRGVEAVYPDFRPMCPGCKKDKVNNLKDKI